MFWFSVILLLSLLSHTFQFIDCFSISKKSTPSSSLLQKKFHEKPKLNDLKNKPNQVKLDSKKPKPGLKQFYDDDDGSDVGGDTGKVLAKGSWKSDSGPAMAKAQSLQFNEEFAKFEFHTLCTIDSLISKDTIVNLLGYDKQLSMIHRIKDGVQPGDLVDIRWTIPHNPESGPIYQITTVEKINYQWINSKRFSKLYYTMFVDLLKNGTKEVRYVNYLDQDRVLMIADDNEEERYIVANLHDGQMISYEVKSKNKYRYIPLFHYYSGKEGQDKNVYQVSFFEINNFTFHQGTLIHYETSVQFHDRMTLYFGFDLSNTRFFLSQKKSVLESINDYQDASHFLKKDLWHAFQYFDYVYIFNGFDTVVYFRNYPSLHLRFNSTDQYIELHLGLMTYSIFLGCQVVSSDMKPKYPPDLPPPLLQTESTTGGGQSLTPIEIAVLFLCVSLILVIILSFIFIVQQRIRKRKLRIRRAQLLAAKNNTSAGGGGVSASGDGGASSTSAIPKPKSKALKKSKSKSKNKTTTNTTT